VSRINIPFDDTTDIPIGKVGGTGAASTLHMTDEEQKAALEREKRKPVFGFGGAAKRRRRKRA